MIEAYKNYWKGYFDFSGKTTVGGYWWAVLAHFLTTFVLSFIITLIGFRGAQQFANTFLITFTLICLPPSLAIMVRRLRDAGYSWVNLFWTFLPLVGAVILIIRLCQPTSGGSQGSFNINNRPASTSNIPVYTPPSPAYQPSRQPSFQSSFGIGFRKLSLSSLQPYTGSGVCDVCNRPLSGTRAYIVPNSVFYSSPEWREHFKQMNALIFGFSGVNFDQYIENMRLSDKSMGSAVCDNCIHMFAE